MALDLLFSPVSCIVCLLLAQYQVFPDQTLATKRRRFWKRTPQGETVVYHQVIKGHKFHGELNAPRKINMEHNIIMEVWKIIFLSKWVICRFHVNLPGCIWCSLMKVCFPFHSLSIHQMNQTSSRSIFQRLEPPLVVEISCCFSFVFLKNLQPHMATPSRVEDWFQLVPHLVWEEGANPAGSPLPWNHGGSDLRFQCPSTKCGAWGWRSLCIESFRPVNLIRDGVWDERIIISQYFFACCSNIFVFVSGRFQIPKGLLWLSEPCRRCQRILMIILQATWRRDAGKIYRPKFQWNRKDLYNFPSIVKGNRKPSLRPTVLDIFASYSIAIRSASYLITRVN